MERLRNISRFVTDRSNLTLLFFIVISLAITWATVNQIEYNYRLEQRSRTLEAEIGVLQQQQTNQELRNQFYETDYYLDLAARKQLGLVKPGEKVALINQSDIDAVLNESKQSIDQPQSSVVKQESASNLEQWARFFSGQEPL
ncbi:septum formation initiator family protein [Candidatus Saccharibacteria bacterium]|nr:septum formation initiator family protein [Candidatus Saccharibacteria bacterium]MCB9821036.1 septum formation initiator family protein [Candidatus Nomurabacteria bacterium]